jgi:glycosyltransferase involved in cell wall biosynthesis
MEGMSMMLLEAASLGAPMICSDIPQNRYALDPHGCYFRSDDVVDLAEKLTDALAHNGAMRERAAAVRSHVLAKFSWGQIVEEYDRVFGAVGRHGTVRV